MAGKVVSTVLQRYSYANLTRDNFLTTLYSMGEIDIGGVQVGPFSAQCNMGARKVWVASMTTAGSLSYLTTI